ncbi:MAG: T9SS type A sorting domain-containing protein [Candidatus Cloacimonetes bacterium]|nr:T9SS type A sorting domain-containing protein [Candidatus Cloacimonadota bacterium]
MKNLAIIICLVQLSLVYSTVIIVNLDGSGDYVTIHEAIIESADFDTILVFPGEYIGGIDYDGKTLVIGSLYMFTGDESYIHTTLIDGDNDGPVVKAVSYEGEGTKLIGFTLHHGFDTSGGGLAIAHSTIEVRNCIIEDNRSVMSAGAIRCKLNSNLLLRGTTIRRNLSYTDGGGIVISSDSDVEFSQKDLCSIYDNHGSTGQDILWTLDDENPEVKSVYVDTFSCLTPDMFFIRMGNTDVYTQFDYLDLHVNTAYYEFYDGDLYVSPNGNDANSGINPLEAMQTIDMAMKRIIPNPEENRTIHLLPGTYSPELNNQIFPLNMKLGVNIIGASMLETIIDAQGCNFLRDNSSSGFNYELRDITFINGPGMEESVDQDFYFANDNFEYAIVYLNDLLVVDSYQEAFNFRGNIEFEMNNITITGFEGGLVWCQVDPGCHSAIQNCLVSAAGCGIIFRNGCFDGDRARLDVINCLIVDNFYNSTLPISSAYNILADYYTEINLINCTIMNNANPAPANVACVGIESGADFNIYNSCIYGNHLYELAVDTRADGITGSLVNIGYSLIEEGEAGIPINGEYPTTLNWLEGNLDCAPLVDEEYFALQNSPLIDGGTMQLPEGIELPEYDLAGNLRIMGNSVDIGAYEFYATGTPDNEVINTIENGLLVYPNPLIGSKLRGTQARILWMGKAVSEDVQFDIFNVKGQKVKSISNIRETDNGSKEAGWDLTDIAGKQVSSGVYFVRLKSSGSYQAQRKVVVVD